MPFEHAESRRRCDDVQTELLAHTPQSAMRGMRRRHGGAVSLVHLHVLHVIEHEGPQSMRSLAEPSARRRRARPASSTAWNSADCSSANGTSVTGVSCAS
jgi:hypothetical protein